METPKKSKDCIFCKIVEGKLPSKKVLETERVFAFKDISPQAPVHVLIVPKVHIADVQSVETAHSSVFQDIFSAAKVVAQELGLEKGGYRTVFNTGEHACQTVFHLHLHLLGGAQMGGSMVG